MPSVTMDMMITKPTPRGCPSGRASTLFTEPLPWLTPRLKHAGQTASTESERDDPTVDEAAREGVRGHDLDAVEVAEEPLEVDEDAGADSVHLLQAGQVVDGDAGAERGVVEQPSDQGVRQLGEDQRR